MSIRVLIAASAGAAAILSFAAAHAQTEPAAQPAPSTPPAATTTTTTTQNGVIVHTITNGPVADTPENRAKFPPLSATGRNTKPEGR